MTAIYRARGPVLAFVIERFVDQFDFSSLAPAQRDRALRELALLRPTLGHGNPRLAAALKRFEDRLRFATVKGARNRSDSKRLNRMLRWLVPLAMSGAVAGTAMLGATPAFAYTAPAVGATVFNYVTNRSETVVAHISFPITGGTTTYAVVTNYNQIIMLTTTVGDTYKAENADATYSTYKVTAVTTSPLPAGGGTYVSSISVIKTNADGTAISGEVASSINVYRDGTQIGTGGGGTGGVGTPFPATSGDQNRKIVNNSGATGGAGADGGGIRICIPLIGCATIGKSPTNGGGGLNGSPITLTATDFASAISSTSDNAPGVVLISNGGNGGRGGDSYAININGANGGNGGTGGTINATIGSGTSIVTSGKESHGIYAQSSGGTGGRGGNGYGASSAGSGGSAGAGGSITIDNMANIHTTGVGAVGILAQSRGGGAGNGGDSYGIVGDSGNGSSGGGGGTVSITNGGVIWTENQYAHGIVAQSIGGFGGTSGDSGGIVASVGAGGVAGSGGSASIRLTGTGSVRTDGAKAHALLAQSIGGNGGAVGDAGGIAVVGGNAGGGAKGGAVSVQTDAGSQIQTGGDGSYGIFAESVGGNGGDIGWSGGAVTFGGSSGAGNDGGTVTVTANGSIATTGIDSRGIFAQSVGGGGGNAGNSYGLVALGGSGGAGGVGKTVSITLGSTSAISTTGFGAAGVFAQSVGGGGGAGAFSGGLVALGGSGSVGGAGGQVSITNGGSISTADNWARGLFAQSIGGGGGAGGGSGGAVAIGGSASAASNGGQVTIGNSGSIVTAGAHSAGMFGQSVGGGGGDGGTSGGLFAIGGTGGAGGEGGRVTASLSGTIATNGFLSEGLYAQSVGGGGGNGGGAYSGSAFVGLAIGGAGSAGGQGGLVEANFANRSVTTGGTTLSLTPLITTGGDFSRGVFLQSVGGGGGSGGMAVQVSAGIFGAASFAIGGKGSVGAQGGTVTADGDVSIFTEGDFSEGFLAQSVGGGGGNGGAAVSVALSGGIGASGALSVGVGGSGAGGGVGGSVDVDSGGSIVTLGQYSTGLIAQSVGGGGGNGGLSISVSGAGSDGVAVAGSLSIGGAGGGGGAGGQVDAIFDGAISTGTGIGVGNNSHGALIQSVGGGGGSGGFSVAASVTLSGGTSVGASVGLGGNGGSGGTGGVVNGNVGGEVITFGHQSSGVVIQSAGGGGGTGGFNISGNIAASGGVGVGISVGLGGSGGSGGSGGTTTGTAGGPVTTYGDQSDGVLIQSVGGGGGSGGFNISGNISLAGAGAGAIGVGLGGTGGGAGTGGIVTGTAANAVTTYGDGSRGVLVQSVGGGGGAGGFNVTGGLTFGGTAAGSIGVGLGGSGGGGGGAQLVTANARSVTTSGDDSAGFIAQSVGGGGGVGGFNVSGSMDFGGTGGGNINVGLGGSGGSGGSAGGVTATLVGTASTLGDRSNAILAQSIGGGGGMGGLNVTGGLSAGGTGAGSVAVGLGGSGGTAGHGGTVTLNVTGHAISDGVESAGIVAQSVGGGGGMGAINITGTFSGGGVGSGSVGIGLGGQGGGGGNGGIVNLNVNNGVTTSDLLRLAAVTDDDDSAGIIAQALGGGGGNGGFNVTAGITYGGTGSGSLGIGIGGSGGAGGNAGAVTADISGMTWTTGDDSLGVLAQSVGGGGGNGGFNVSGGIAIGGTGSGSVNIGIGGSGGSGGNAGAATLRINDQITTPGQLLIAALTEGDKSSGIVTQSLGGGGGNGGFNVSGTIALSGTGAGAGSIGIGGMGGSGGFAGNATADITGAVGTSGDESDGIVVQSIGGGGGNGGFNVSGALTASKGVNGTLAVGIGGFGGDGGDAGEARLDLNMRTADTADTLTSVSTDGNEAAGIIVQSLGGGGGNGGFNVSGGMAFSKGGSGNVGVGVGGFGGGGGNAAKTTANINGDILTNGNESIGLLVQSLGGGGGNGAFNVTAGLAASKSASGNIGVGIGGFGGDGGDGKTVFATVTSDIQTSGIDSDGATIQSVGGGGGNGGFNVTGGISASLGESASGNLGVGIGGFGGNGGHGDEVTATLVGSIHTAGADSHGVMVQSAGGGGGDGGFNVTGSIAVTKGSSGSLGIGVGGFGGDGGDGKKVTASLTGDILTTGDKSFGATFQSLGGGGGNGGFNVTGGINVSLGESASGNLNIGIGGFGGGGGDAGAVIGTLIGNVQTTGFESHGGLMQAVGGGGGNGGMNISGGVALSKGATGSIGFGLGGFGGDGGHGGTVTGTMIGNISTSNYGSNAAVFQSLGGAGGTGAMNITGSVNITKGDSTSGGAAIGIGGFGGGGGNGTTVIAEARGLYSTDGKSSSGVIAQSVGGGGGAGGLNISGQLGVSTQGSGGGAALGLGGFGGDGGWSGNVTLTRVGQTVTRKSNSNGVVAQSVGGGGGLGGINISAGIAGTNSGDSGTVVLGIGGFGGKGGYAGNVTATVVDSVWATGSDAATSFSPDDYIADDGKGVSFGMKTHLLNGSHGILVQSQGGGGGSGGFNISGGISLAKAKEGSKGSALVLGFGGFGGGGGDAGIVNATIGSSSVPRITVEGTGDTKSAIYIGSVGGGGGDGAFNISGGLSTDGQIVVGFGGFGGDGGLGSDVTAVIDANLYARGYKASGLTVQSIGGGGGSGGFNISGGIKPREGQDPVITFGMGGNGGVGNSSGNVDVQHDGQVVVDGFASHGILVQSVAGGGGAGGMDMVANVNQSDGKSKMDGFAAGIGIGGTGGKGGSAGDAYLRNTGDVLVNTIVTTGASGTVLSASNEAGMSAGVTVQSIGGGGGVGGFNFVGVAAASGNPINFAMGGSGGVGGDAGHVTLIRGYLENDTVSRSLINTFGAGSAGLIAQSIGGGGGSAGTNLAFTGGSTTANQTGFGGQFVIGGDGASSGDGKSVSVRHAGAIQTDGIGSDGILAQSIGKGGGNAAVNIGFAKLGEATAFRAKSTKTSSVYAFSVAVGGAAGDAGSAGMVTVEHDGAIVTKQAMSSGLVAQSLAGGGGNVALNLGMLIGGDNSLKASIGREGGNGGISGEVRVTTAGTILANGDQSNGIVAQSVGGAGGMSGTITVEGQLREGSGTNATNSGGAVSVGLEGGAGGHSDKVTVANSADIQTNGDSARGIIAQSIGGDGGIAGSARTFTTGQSDSLAVAVGGGGGGGAVSGKVDVDNNGLIITKGKNSDGILAQSVGGGGGVGGSAATIKLPTGGLDNKSASTVAVAVGGSGGAGAIAGDVKVRNDGVILTEQDTSFGIRAQSIGGGGGVGGATYNVQSQKAETVNTFNVLIGGGGGSGQLAGRVDVFNYGLIHTTGAGSSGISANSIGGGGGDAGSVSSVSILLPQTGGKSNSFALAIGGAGGSGGTGGAVNVVNAPTSGVADSGSIFTTGSAAHGIFAQSLGGGGGNGSSIASFAFSNGAKESISVGLNLGGSGGDGNTGGEVTVNNSGLIHTTGEGSIGILAQSIGGGGGNGGVVLSANILLKSRDKSPLISIGGIGGAGNDGGHVSVVNSGDIFTSGKNADGIVAQSIGGGGGKAGLALALTGDIKTLIASNVMAVVVGAIGGGNSGVGGQVDVTHSGDITVLGEGSHAIVAESINGGGGSVHFNLDGISMPSLSAALPDVAIPPLGELDGIPNLVKGEPHNRPVEPRIVAARMGASDATSMNAGKVNVTISGTIGAGGDYGSGSTVRSIGGGGGSVNFTATVIKPEAPEPGSVSAQMIYAIGLGAKNSLDSSGADIESTHSGQIVTTGRGSAAVLLQSIGGGGGSAVVDLKVEDPADVESIRLGLGAVGTSGSHGGNVNRDQSGGVFTSNNLAHGAVVQSIGGGGGTAIAHIEQIPAAATALMAGAQGILGWSTSAEPMSSAIVSLGATGGSDNDAGALDLSFSGGFMTTGDWATGLVLQAIGAGGGEVILDGLEATSIILGGQAGASGDGGAITLANNGDVLTAGFGSHGILLQSIGGGGGAVFGDFAAAGVTLSAANVGDGGTIAFAQDGDIAAIGDGAVALIAQSLGGGGGFVDGLFAGTSGGVGHGGAIGLEIDGGIVAYGVDSTAVLAQSLGSLGGSNITIGATGDVRGGSAGGVGIALDGGANNLVTIDSSLSAVSGLAMTGTTGNDRLENRGLTVGNVVLGGGANLVHTSADASFLTIDTLDLRDGTGSTGLFDNDGTLLMGLEASRWPIDLLNGATFALPVITNPLTDLLVGTSVISQVALDGDFRQSTSGLMNYDIAFGPYASDRIDATGNAVVDGTANIILTWLENNDKVTLISTGLGGTDLGLNPVDTLAINFGILADPAGVHLTVETDFGLDFLNYNQEQIGQNLDSSVLAGGAGGIGRLMAMIGNLTAGQEDNYASFFAELDPESLLAPTIEQLDAARDFGTGVMGCRPGDARAAKCVFARVEGHGLERHGGEMDVDFDTSARLRLGGALSLGSGWRLGGELGIDDGGDFASDSYRTRGSEGRGFHAGVGIGKLFAGDRGEATIALTAGNQRFDTARYQNIFEEGFGLATIRTRYVGANGYLGYTLSSGSLFATPAVDLQAIRMTVRDFEESGLDGTGARSDGTKDWYLSATPKLTAGVKSGPVMLSGTVGYQISDAGKIVVPIRLVGSPDESDPAMIRTLIDKEMLLLGVNAEVKAGANTAFEFGFKGLYGDKVNSESVSAKLKVRF